MPEEGTGRSTEELGHSSPARGWREEPSLALLPCSTLLQPKPTCVRALQHLAVVFPCAVKPIFPTGKERKPLLSGAQVMLVLLTCCLASL